MTQNTKPILDVLQNRKPDRVPFWLMRQAGRYLPEYRELRAAAGSFLNLVYDPQKAAEVTIQPIRRFGMDAAILFSDILVVPDALGQAVTFETGEGPRLDALQSEKDFLKLKAINTSEKFSRVFETVSKTSHLLKSEGYADTTLIGFCGSPWTVACYMIEGHGSKDFEKARVWAFKNPQSFQTLIDIVVDASCTYLSGQINAGAEVIQLFDSWSGLLDSQGFLKWVIEPTKKIRNHLRENHPQIPVIGFPRGAGVLVHPYARMTGVDCIGLDQTIDPAWAGEWLQNDIAVQGNLDPVRLLCGGHAMEDALSELQTSLIGGRWIFNLGHGVIKETNVDHIHKLKEIIHGWKL